jgi:hypothetical protein
MWPHFINLLGRSWESFRNSLGTTTWGFVAPLIVSIISIFVSLHRIKKQHGIEAMLKHWKQDAVTALRVAFFVGLSVYGLTFVYVGIIRNIYGDHQSLVSKNQALIASDAKLSANLELHRHSIVTGDPVFPNTIYLLQAFDVYRHYRKGAPCVLYVSATPGDSGLSSVVAQFSNSASDCFTFGPFIGGNPYIDKLDADGAIPGKIVFHAA